MDALSTVLTVVSDYRKSFLGLLSQHSEGYEEDVSIFLAGLGRSIVPEVEFLEELCILLLILSLI